MTVNVLYQGENFQWIDILGMKQEDIASISEKYNINSLLLEDCIDPNHLPKFEDLGDLKFYLTRLNNSTERTHLNSISDVSTKLGVFLRDNLILTVHRIESDAIKSIINELNSNKLANSNPYKIALKLAQNIFKSFDNENDVLQEQMDTMENEIFMKNISNSNQLKRLYLFKRKVGLNLKVLNLSADWVNNLDKLPLEDIEIKDLKDSYKDSISDFDHLTYQITNLISLFLALSDQKANQTMKMLAIYSVYFLPITFIAGVYGMNFKFMPELEHPYGYFATIGLMLLVVLVTFIYVKRKKW